MWFFGTRKGNKSAPDERPGMDQLIARPDILELHNNDAELRVWLPELCKKALDETVAHVQLTGSRYLRELFVIYLYGVHELMRMRAEKSGLYFDPPPPPPSPRDKNAVMYSRASGKDVIPGLGKNIVALKIFLPQKIKDDLQGMADKAGIPLSQFVREILVSHFLGHTLWPERLRSWTPEEEEIALNWEQGKIEPEFIYDEESNGDSVIYHY